MNTQQQRSVGVPVVLVCTGMALMACIHACTSHQTAIAAQVHAPYPIMATPQPGAREVYELREKCASDSRVWFQENFPDPAPTRMKGGNVSTTPPSYENHYSPAKNGCFVLVTEMTTFSGKTIDTLQSAYLWNVMENSQVGTYVVKDLSEIATCEVGGLECTSRDEWSTLINPYVAD